MESWKIRSRDALFCSNNISNWTGHWLPLLAASILRTRARHLFHRNGTSDSRSLFEHNEPRFLQDAGLSFCSWTLNMLNGRVECDLCIPFIRAIVDGRFDTMGIVAIERPDLSTVGTLICRSFVLRRHCSSLRNAAIAMFLVTVLQSSFVRHVLVHVGLAKTHTQSERGSHSPLFRSVVCNSHWFILSGALFVHVHRTALLNGADDVDAARRTPTNTHSMHCSPVCVLLCSIVPPRCARSSICFAVSTLFHSKLFLAIIIGVNLNKLYFVVCCVSVFRTKTPKADVCNCVSIVWSFHLLIAQREPQCMWNDAWSGSRCENTPASGYSLYFSLAASAAAVAAAASIHSFALSRWHTNVFHCQSEVHFIHYDRNGRCVVVFVHRPRDPQEREREGEWRIRNKIAKWERLRLCFGIYLFVL